MAAKALEINDWEIFVAVTERFADEAVKAFPASYGIDEGTYRITVITHARSFCGFKNR